MISPENFEAAGLIDLQSPTASSRLELLRWLEGCGYSLAEMVEANERMALAALPGDRRLAHGERLSKEQALELSGLDPEAFDAIATGFGLNPWLTRNGAGDHSISYGLTETEVQALAVFHQLSDMFSEEEVLAFVRVVGSSLERIAEASVSLFLADIEGPMLASSASELEVGRKMLESIELLDEFAPVLDPMLRRHLVQAIDRGRLTMIDQMERLEYRYAIGFVDLVGFTPISRGMTAKQLSNFLHTFEGRAHEAVTAAGARLVKFIGDEVMFVAPDADSACQVAQALMSELVTDDVGRVLPRAGLAYGDVLVRGGDYYGEVVNLASRLVDEAEPQELLVNELLAANATGLDFEPAGLRTVKGFAEPVAVKSIRFPTSPS